MCWSLRDYQSKGNRYSNGLIYLKNKVTTNQKHTIESQKNQKETNSKWLKDLNITHDTINFSQENIGKTLFDIHLSNVFVGQSKQPKQQK